MNKKPLILNLIDAICEVIRVKKEHDIGIQDLHHANILFNQIVQDQESLVEFLQAVNLITQTVSDEDRRKIFWCIARMFRDMILFDEECGRILKLRKEAN